MAKVVLQRKPLLRCHWQRSRKMRRQGDAKKYINYSDPLAAAAMKEAANYYYKTGKYLTLEDCMISNKPYADVAEWLDRCLK